MSAILNTATVMSFSKFPPSLCAPTLPSTLSDELKMAALVPMDALLLQLLPLRPFAEVVLQKDLREFLIFLQFSLFSTYCCRVNKGFPVSLRDRDIVYNLLH